MHSPFRNATFPVFGCAPWALAILGGLAAMTLGLHGCVGYNNITPIEGSSGSPDANLPPVPMAMATALRWVVDRYPPNGEAFTGVVTQQPFAVNFPAGVQQNIVEQVLRYQPPNAQVLTPDNENLPIYHIARIWIRGGSATIDILVPTTHLGPGPRGQAVYQGITVNLSGGFKPWYVTSHKVWPVGALDVPGLNYLVVPHPDAKTSPVIPAEDATPAPTPEPVMEPVPSAPDAGTDQPAPKPE